MTGGAQRASTSMDWLKGAGSSAQSAGFSPVKKPMEPVQSCPFASGDPAAAGPAGVIPPAHAHADTTCYDHCTLQSLTLEMTATGTAPGARTTLDPIKLTKRRIPEGIKPAVYDRYKSNLGGWDLVIEALADTAGTHVEFAPASYLRPVGSGTSSASQVDTDSRGLDLRLTAVNAASHSSFSPAHPYTSAGSLATGTDGGVPITTSAYAAERGGGFLSRIASFFPFSEDRTRTYGLGAKSCGNCPSKPLEELSMYLVVMPHEEWRIKLGLAIDKTTSWSKESGRDFSKYSDDSKQYGSKTIVEKTRGGRNFEEKSEEYFGTDEMAEKHTLRQYNSGPVPLTFYKVEDSQATNKPNDRALDKPDGDTCAGFSISVTCKSAGKETELKSDDIKDWLERFKEAEHIVDRLLSVAKVGFSVTKKLEYFTGDFNIGFGTRWPAGYAEQDRVYYIERYLSIGLSGSFSKGSFEAMAGLEVDPWFAPVTIVGKLYCTASFDFGANCNLSRNWTNPQVPLEKHPSADAGMYANAKLEAGLKAGGRAFGYSLICRYAVEASVELSARGEVSIEKGIEAYLGYKWGGIQAVGEIECSSFTPKIRKLKPKELWAPQPYVETQVL